jgi:hypothetical protein
MLLVCLSSWFAVRTNAQVWYPRIATGVWTPLLNDPSLNLPFGASFSGGGEIRALSFMNISLDLKYVHHFPSNTNARLQNVAPTVGLVFTRKNNDGIIHPFIKFSRNHFFLKNQVESTANLIGVERRSKWLQNSLAVGANIRINQKNSLSCQLNFLFKNQLYPWIDQGSQNLEISYVRNFRSGELKPTPYRYGKVAGYVGSAVYMQRLWVHDKVEKLSMASSLMFGAQFRLLPTIYIFGEIGVLSGTSNIYSRSYRSKSTAIGAQYNFPLGSRHMLALRASGGWSVYSVSRDNSTTAFDQNALPDYAKGRNTSVEMDFFFLKKCSVYVGHTWVRFDRISAYHDRTNLSRVLKNPYIGARFYLTRIKEKAETISK